MNNPPGDNDFGDKILAIFQGQTGYVHQANHIAEQKEQQVRTGTVEYQGDIEGVWTYVYFSFSQVVQRAVSFVSFNE